jgi:hypothetical protein
VTHLCVSRSGPYIVLDIKANAFLHHMVRNITGSLLLVGQGTNRWRGLPRCWQPGIATWRARPPRRGTLSGGRGLPGGAGVAADAARPAVAAGLGTGYDQFLVTGPENLWFNDPSFIAIELLSH